MTRIRIKRHATTTTTTDLARSARLVPLAALPGATTDAATTAAAVLAGAALAAGCGGSSNQSVSIPAVAPAKMFTLAGFQPSAPIVPGRATTVSFTVTMPDGKALTSYKTGPGPHTRRTDERALDLAAVADRARGALLRRRGAGRRYPARPRRRRLVSWARLARMMNVDGLA